MNSLQEYRVNFEKKYTANVMRVHVLKYMTSMLSLLSSRPPDKSVYWKIIFFISRPKHMLRVLKRTISMRRCF